MKRFNRQEMGTEEAPVRRLEQLLDALQQTQDGNGIATASTSRQSSVAQLALEVHVELRRFVRAEFALADLVQLWTEFDAEEATLQGKDDVDWGAVLRKLEELAQEMDEAGGNWGKNACQAARLRIEAHVGNSLKFL